MEQIKTAVNVDRKLETKHADAIIQTLEKAQEAGSGYVVFEVWPMDLALYPAQLDFFKSQDEALDEWELKADGGYLPGDADHPVYFREVGQLLSEIRLANSITQKEENKQRPTEQITKASLPVQPTRKKSKGRRI